MVSVLQVCVFILSTILIFDFSFIDAKTLQIAAQVFLERKFKLVAALEKLGTRLRPITSGVFSADYLEKEKYGLIRKILLFVQAHFRF